MLTNIKLVLSHVTAIHGTNQLLRLNNKSLMLWFTLMLANLALMLSYLIVISHRYNNDQIVTRINANCKVNQIPFPAVTICNFNMVSQNETTGIVSLLKTYNISQHRIDLFLKSLPNLKDFSNGGITDRFTKIMDILESHYINVETVMEEVHQKCDHLLVYCSFNRKIKNCREMFYLIKTYEGYCCAFNYAALNNDHDKFFLNDPDIDYYVDPSSESENSNIIVTSQSGSGSGLSVVFNVEAAEYASWSRVPYYGAKVLISDPNDYPEITVLYKYVTIGESLDIKVEPMIFQSDEEIRRVPLQKRGCYFHDEVVLEHTNRYSYETCQTECKMQRFFDICGCIPYKYPTEKLHRTCNFKDLPCLSDLKARKLRETEACQPPCFSECRDKQYRITSDIMPFVSDFYPPAISRDNDVSELASLQVYFSKSTCNCYKQTLLMDYNYFIATYGGVFSLSFGASILTAVEILYLLLSRLVYCVVKTKIK